MKQSGKFNRKEAIRADPRLREQGKGDQIQKENRKERKKSKLRNTAKILLCVSLGSEKKERKSFSLSIHNHCLIPHVS